MRERSLFSAPNFIALSTLHISLPPPRNHPPPDVNAGRSAEAAENILVWELPQPQLPRVPDPRGRVKLCGECSEHWAKMA